ncbi:DUF3093 domain-containing protein [Gulosibacter bifidus]|uniref:DUF3093 domain-containing protein n=1 Tax=Gulosibacter bifidus TaxID=272239 RepID=A0ABW5RH65_9MICO|nr:DUF3093 domain-containing protein [Gulosibacter bifidus]
MSPTIWMYVIGALVIPAVMAVFIPINMIVGIILGVALFAGYCAALYGGSPIIEVSASTLRVGSANIPINLVGDVTANDNKTEARQAAGPGLDARAWICLRGWVGTNAKIEINDERDPIPYWLVSTREPAALAAAISQAKARSTSAAR